mgnify:CR=1 FL=1
MKNIYEMPTKDKDKYRGEFNKLDFAKKINGVRRPALFFVIVALCCSGILSGLVDEGIKLQAWVDFVDTIGIISLAVFAALHIYLNISFIRWMKIKHDIEY